MVQIISYANLLYDEHYLRTYQYVAVYFTIRSIVRNFMYYRKYETLHVPMQSCVVCDVVVFCASFGCDRVRLWSDDLPRFSKMKRKMPPRKFMGKGLNVSGNLEKSHGTPQKRFERIKWESSIHLLLMIPVCCQTSLCL